MEKNMIRIGGHFVINSENGVIYDVHRKSKAGVKLTPAFKANVDGNKINIEKIGDIERQPLAFGIIRKVHDVMSANIECRG